MAAQVEPGFLAKSIPSEAPESPQDFDLIQNEYESIIMPGITHWQHPNFYAYYPCNATFEGAIADLYCAAISNPGFNWNCSPSVTELEILMMDWIAKMLGLSDAFWSTSPSGTGGGIILGSASEVTLTVAIAARERAIGRLSDKFPMPEVDTTASGDAAIDASSALAEWRGRLTSKLVMYGTTQVRHSSSSHILRRTQTHRAFSCYRPIRSAPRPP